MSIENLTVIIISFVEIIIVSILFGLIIYLLFKKSEIRRENIHKQEAKKAKQERPMEIKQTIDNSIKPLNAKISYIETKIAAIEKEKIKK